MTEVYAKVGGNATFDVRPPVMHFGGYSLGSVHKQRFVVTNLTSSSKRLHIVVPTTPYFKATFEKRGLMAPGMSEVITIEFCPTETRYFYDCVRIHNEDENLLVPIHAYPVMNEVVFPKTINFGKCGVKRRHSRKISLQCKVPIAFEYELLPSSESKVFDVQPRKGIVPANGEVNVDVSFTPNQLTTCTMEILVKISQFNFKPFACIVTGTGFPSVARDQGVAELTGEDPGTVDAALLVEGTTTLQQPPGREGFGRHGSQGAAGGKTSRSATAHSLAATFNSSGGGGGLGAGRTQKASGGAGGGAGGGDAYTEYVHHVRKEAAAVERSGVGGLSSYDLNTMGSGMMRTTFAPDAGATPSGPGPRHVKLSDSLGGSAHSHLTLDATASDFNALPLQPEEENVDGVFVPPHISGHATANYVLMQRRGKLRIKDLKAAVAAKNDENATMEAGTMGVAGGVNGALAALDDPEVDIRVKELIFEKEFARVLEFERTKEVRVCVAVGGNLLSEEEEEAVHKRRQDRAAAFDRAETASAMARPGVEATLGASYVVGEDVDAGVEAEDPEYNPETNDTWRMRQEICARFIQAGRKVILQNRAEKRLKGIRLMKAKIGDKGKAAAYVAHEILSGAGKNSGLKPDPDVVEPAKFKASRIRDHTFPVYRESEFRMRSPVDVSMAGIGDLEQVEPMELKKPLSWKLKGYTFEDDAAKAPPIDAYQPLMLDQPVYAGAEEEEGPTKPRARGLLDPAGDGALPVLPGTAAEKDPPFEIPLPEPAPAVSLRVVPEHSCVLAPALPVWGEDLAVAVRPATYGFKDSLSEERAGCNATAALLPMPTLSELWLPRRDAWQLPEEVPVLMSGPSAADLMADEDGEGFGGTGEPVPPPADIPTAEKIAAAFYLPAVEAAKEAAAAAGESGDGEEGAGAGTGAPPPQYEIPRQRREAELDEKVRERRETLLARLRDRTTDFNALITDPKLRWEL